MVVALVCVWVGGAGGDGCFWCFIKEGRGPCRFGQVVKVDPRGDWERACRSSVCISDSAQVVLVGDGVTFPRGGGAKRQVDSSLILLIVSPNKIIQADRNHDSVLWSPISGQRRWRKNNSTEASGNTSLLTALLGSIWT